MKAPMISKYLLCFSRETPKVEMDEGYHFRQYVCHQLPRRNNAMVAVEIFNQGTGIDAFLHLVCCFVPVNIQRVAGANELDAFL